MPSPNIVRAILLATTLTTLGCAQAAPTVPIYTDALQNGWQNFSWATVDLAAKTPVHTGAASVKVTCTGAWQGFYLHHDPLNAALYSTLTFWINGGGTADHPLTISEIVGKDPAKTVNLAPYIDGGAIPANQWKKVTVPLADLGAPTSPNCTGFWIMGAGAAQAPYFLDDIALTQGDHPAVAAPIPANPAVQITVDARANRHPINPLIYGVAYGTAQSLALMNCPLNRMGGNNTSRYNWKLNADNRGNDWFFESIPDTSPTPGERADTFIRASHTGGAQPMMTIPMVGWVAKLGPDRQKLASYSIAKYGPQTKHDQYMPDAGNGVSSADQKPITSNDPNDANVPADSAFQKPWVQHLVGAWGKAQNGGLRYYLLDNEPSIWQSTHRDVHPIGPKMDEILTKTLDYSAMIKSIDPGALIVGPEEWGWSGYIFSGYDQQWGSQHGWATHPDRDAHGGMDYLPWLLQSLHKHDTAAKTRSLDVFTVHYYPQGGEFGNDTSTAMQLRRNRSTRSLWDPNYVDETWIRSKINLIPRLKGWVKTYYPGLQIGITEYNWGADANINGATAQADVLGIFGREGLDIGARWTSPEPQTPTFKAFQMYRNYDGKKSTFGDISVQDTVPDPDTLSSFAAIRTDEGALTLMVINKQLTGATPLTVNLQNFTAAGPARAWQLTAANTIIHLPDVPLAGGKLTASLPAQSITLFVLPGKK